MKAIPVHQAKANLSKYIIQAKAGKPVYIGRYGEAEVVLTATTKRKGLKLGVWADKYKPNAYKDEDLIGPDQELINDFEKAINKPL
ncbi:MAG: type II toxin-antitoxin system Phd/YefM family antitoxin [Candidatus Saccharimonadales bacterium]